MLAEIASDVIYPVLLSLLAAGAAALALSVAAVFGVLDRRRWPFPPLALVLLASAGWVVLYANGPDRFYPVTRWGWAARSWPEPVVVVAAVAVALATAVALLRAARSNGTVRLRRLAMPATALACFGLLVATLALGTGH